MPFKPKMKVKGPKVRVVKPKVSISLWTCPTCRKSGNPLTHVCVQKASRSPEAKAARKRSR